jgi:hypothetical protein
MPRFSQKNKNAKKRRIMRITLMFKNSKTWLKMKANRRTSANILMLCFIICTSIGAGMMFPPAGWVVAGVTSGIFGFLLGLE